MTQKKLCENQACQQENDVNTKFCVKCGQPFTTTSESAPKLSPIKPDVCVHVNNGTGKFCVKCGELFVNNDEPSIPVAHDKIRRNHELRQVQKKKSSFMNKKLAVILAALLVVIVASWWILEKTLSNKDSLTTTLEQVVVSGDVNKLYEVLTLVEVSDVEKKAYKEYLKENGVSEIANTLVKSINVLHESNQLLTQAATEDSEADQFKIVKTKKIVVFQSYEIRPIKFKIFAETNSDDIELSMAGENKQLSVEENVAVGEYLPGEYPYSLTWSNEIGSVKKERKFYVRPTKSNVLDGTLPMYEVDLIDGPYNEWTYLINGKQLDLKQYVDDGRLVVPEDMEFTLVATFKEGAVVYESEPVQITGTTYPDFNFPKYKQKLEMEVAKEEAEREREEAKLEAEVKIATLISDYLMIYSNGYVDALDTVISTDSEFYSQQTKYLQSLNDKNTQAEVNDYNIVSFKENGSDSYTVIVDERYTIYTPNANPNQVTQKSIYTVKLIGSDYYITGLKLGK